MSTHNILSLDTWFSVGARRRPRGVYEWIFTPFAVAIGVWVITAATAIIISPWTLCVIFFSGISALAFLTTGPFQNSSVEKPSILDMAFFWYCSLFLIKRHKGLYYFIFQNS